jgi:hypothetical protein
MRRNRFSVRLVVLGVTLLLPAAISAAGVTVLTVPWDPNNPLSPHTTYPLNGTTEATIVLQATVPSAVGSADSFSVSWNFGDGSPNAAFALTNPYDISVTHQYPASAGAGTAWTAVVTVTDTTTAASGQANYYVIQSANNLAARVNVAIDTGLWYMHQTMWRQNAPANGQTVNWGGWDTQGHSCTPVGGLAYDCTYPGVIDATNIQAFEVSGHLASGPAADPYTDDVQRAFARMFVFLSKTGAITNTYLYNPAAVNYGCSDGTPPNTSGNCGGAATKVFYNSASTTCTGPPCSVFYDGNANGQAIYSNDGSGEPIYTGGPFVDAVVASGTPAATAPTGVTGIFGQSYATIVQDMLDYYGGCQYENDTDGSNPAYPGYTRGAGYSAQGGGWLYTCQEGDDNSTSQWAAISFVSGFRGSGFNLPIPTAVRDFNNVWVTNSQDVQNAAPTGPNPYSTGNDRGAFGYRGSLYYSNAWGSFAVTPSGMVQMVMDNIGRTTSTAVGDATTAPDQRWNDAETYYADNFCNQTSGQDAVYAPRNYTYGLFSFTKSMLLHDPNGALAPIQYLRTKTPNVFTGNASVPPNTIDWYAALSPANGGSDACDGVAQTLVGFQSADGHWYGHDYDQGYQGGQSPFETAWSIIMLKKTVFVTCINNLAGRGNASGPTANLSWSAQTNATSYAVLRSSVSGGPYAQVGTTNLTAFRDANSGLARGNTYYYVVQPLQGTTEICQSNEAKIVIP